MLLYSCGLVMEPVICFIKTNVVFSTTELVSETKLVMVSSHFLFLTTKEKLRPLHGLMFFSVLSWDQFVSITSA